MYKFKLDIKIITKMLVMILVFTMSSVNIFADSYDITELNDLAHNYDTEVLSREILEKEGYIIIDSVDAAAKLKKEDYEKFKKERLEKLENIPSYVIEEYDSFLDNELEIEFNNDYRIDLDGLKNDIKKINDFNNINGVEEFRKSCNNQNISAIDNDILANQLMTLKNTTVEDMILSYFSLNDYPISYGLFLHSLVSSPQNLYYNIDGISAYKVNCGDMDLAHTFAYEFLLEKDFIKMIYNFAKAAEYEENKDGFHYEFNRGDLKYSIHGTTNMRLHRKTSGKTYFRIWDVYDFAGTLAYLLDWTTTTNTYGITVEGSYQWS